MNFMKIFLFAASLIASASFAFAMEKPTPKEYTTKDIQHMFGQNKSNYLHKLWFAANILQLQHELACILEPEVADSLDNALCKELKISRESFDNAKEIISTIANMPTKDGFRKLVIASWQKAGATFNTPDCVAFALQFIQLSLTDHKRAESFLEEYKSSNNPEILALIPLAYDLLPSTPRSMDSTKTNSDDSVLIQTYKKIENQYADSLAELFANPALKHIFIPCRILFAKIKSLETEIQKLVATLNLSDADKNKKDLDEKFFDLKSNDVLKTLTMRQTIYKSFVDQYSKSRVEAGIVYEIIRKEITSALLKNKNDKSLSQYAKKMYASKNLIDILPNKLQLPLTQKALSADDKNNVDHAIIPVAPEPKQITQNASIKKNGTRRKKDSKETQPAPQEEIRLQQNIPEAQAHFENSPIIKCITDRINAKKLYVYLSVKQKNKIPEFAYHPRIYEWLKDSAKALQHQGYNDPNNPKYALKDTAPSYHGFSIDIDKYMREYGSAKEELDRTGKRVLFVALPGHIEQNNERKFVIYGYAIDPETKLCYHRCIEERTPEELLNEYLNTQAWHVTLEELINENP